MQNLRIFKDMEANCENCPFNITEGDLIKDCPEKETVKAMLPLIKA